MTRASLDAEANDGHNILVTIHGSRLGYKVELTPSQPTLVVGRDLAADVPVEDDSVSRRHCQFVLAGQQWHIEDLGSTNGTYVGGDAITRRALVDGDLVKVGSTIFKFLSSANVEAAYYEEIYRMAIFDGLTQIHNRRYFQEFTDREISRAVRHERELSLILFDLDRFKPINDTHGHLTGDHALRTLARAISGRIRREELFARYAGDEFVVVLPETDAAKASSFGEMLRALVEETDFSFDGQPLRCTISVGIGSFQPGMSTPAQLLAAADAALYRAKEKGRNTVSL